MSSNESKRFSQIVGIAITAALIATFGAVSAYIFRFGNLPTDDPEGWAWFGDYIGGISSSLVGLATVLLIVQTLRVTRMEAASTRAEMESQTAHLEKQLHHIRTQRVLDEIIKRLDGALAAWWLSIDRPCPYQLSEQIRTSFLPAGLLVSSSLRSLLYRPTLAAELTSFREGRNPTHYKTTWSSALEDELNILSEISSYCLEYEKITENKQLTDYYRHRVSSPVRALNALGIVDKDVYEGLQVGRRVTVYLAN